MIVDCFKEDADDYLINKICTENDFKKYGFVLLKECDKTSNRIMDTMIATFQGKDVEDIPDNLQAEDRAEEQRRAEQREAEERRK